jgi:uncharacterized protein YpiB (UPF0302 family)
MEKMNVSYEVTLSLLAELVLDEAFRSYRQQVLYREIDIALAKKDESSFFSLTNELKLL